jgi:hypothetical protein
MNTNPAAMQRRALVVAPDQGRHYGMGRMSAVFKADGPETGLGYWILEWWLQPDTCGPGAHAHPDVLIPGGTAHDVENRGATRSGFISINVPGGFENKMPHIVRTFTDNPLGEASARFDP